MSKITVVVPAQADGELYELSDYLAKTLGLDGGYGLGGENGYGVGYENDTFMMHPFCWCERDDCKWCSQDEPNFIYKPTGAKVWWYKWIGRGQHGKGTLEGGWLEKCKQSVKGTSPLQTKTINTRISQRDLTKLKEQAAAHGTTAPELAACILRSSLPPEPITVTIRQSDPTGTGVLRQPTEQTQ